MLVPSLLVAVGLAAQAHAHHGTDRLPDDYVIPGETTFPEGIARGARSEHFYVGSTTDGTIYRGHIRRRTLEPFLAGGVHDRTDVRGLEVDRGRLLMAGGATGRIYAYSTSTRQLVRRFDTGTGGFINDQTTTPNGTAYFTDSRRPLLFRIRASQLRSRSTEPTALEPWTNVGDSIPYDAGFNLNGIVSSASGRHLLTVQSNTGRLWRISTRTGAVTEVSLGDARVANGDGLVLNGRMLSVVRNVDQVIAAVRLNDDFTRGRIVEQLGLASFRFPTTAAELGDRLLVVNSQLNRRSAGQPPEAPFTVSLAPKP